MTRDTADNCKALQAMFMCIAAIFTIAFFILSKWGYGVASGLITLLAYWTIRIDLFNLDRY